MRLWAAASSSASMLGVPNERPAAAGAERLRPTRNYQTRMGGPGVSR